MSPSAELVTEGRIVYAGALADQGRLPEALALLRKRAERDQEARGAPPAPLVHARRPRGAGRQPRPRPRAVPPGAPGRPGVRRRRRAPRRARLIQSRRSATNRHDDRHRASGPPGRTGVAPEGARPWTVPRKQGDPRFGLAVWIAVVARDGGDRVFGPRPDRLQAGPTVEGSRRTARSSANFAFSPTAAEGAGRDGGDVQARRRCRARRHCRPSTSFDSGHLDQGAHLRGQDHEVGLVRLQRPPVHAGTIEVTSWPRSSSESTSSRASTTVTDGRPAHGRASLASLTSSSPRSQVAAGRPVLGRTRPSPCGLDRRHGAPVRTGACRSCCRCCRIGPS